MTWGTPWALLLFAPWMAAAWRMLRAGRRKGIAFAPLARLPRHTTWRQRIAWLPPVLFLVGLAAGIVAAARPQTRQARAQRTTDAIAISMVVDISGSMDALDLSLRKGNDWDFKMRLDVVKEVFAEFVERRPTDLIGLVTFGGFATTRSPLTIDHAALRHLLAGVQIPGMDGKVVGEGEAETAIGDGLAMACARLEQASNVVSRIAVLLSDGQANYGIVTPEEATKLAKGLGIKVYTIGVGTTGEAPVKRSDPFGREVIGWKPVRIDEQALKRIASETGGLYFGVRDRKGLENALGQIDTLEKTAVDETVYEDRQEHFAAWLWSCTALLCAAVGLSMAVERRIA
jgi:Ca-activated chloride channel family protein